MDFFALLATATHLEAAAGQATRKKTGSDGNASKLRAKMVPWDLVIRQESSTTTLQRTQGQSKLD
jgi:hypothetical protein